MAEYTIWVEGRGCWERKEVENQVEEFFSKRISHNLGIVTSHLPLLSSSYPRATSGAALKMAVFSHKGKSSRRLVSRQEYTMAQLGHK